MRTERSAGMSRTSFVRAAQRTLAGVVLLTVSTGGLVPQASAGGRAASAAYVAVQPCRLTDTRAGTGFTPVGTQMLQVNTAGTCGIPAGATALALTLTVVDPQANGYLNAWPANQSQPTASSLNFSARQVRANGSIIRVDGTGAFRVYTSVPAHVVVDVVGAFVPASSARAGRFVPVAPQRMYDSRSTGKKFGAGAGFSLALPAGVPSDAVAMAVNVTITDSAGAGFITEYPAGGQRPTSSILNVDGPGQTRAVAGILPVSPAGMSLYVSAGGFVIVDVLGYFTGPSAKASGDGLFTAYDPQRLLDTRGTSPLGKAIPLYPGGGLELATSQGGTLAYNVTSANGAAGYVTAYPAGTAIPATSTVNSVGGGDIVANRDHAGLEPRPRHVQPVGFASDRRSAGLVLRPVSDGDASSSCQRRSGPRRRASVHRPDVLGVLPQWPRRLERPPCIRRRRCARREPGCRSIRLLVGIATCPGLQPRQFRVGPGALVQCGTRRSFGMRRRREHRFTSGTTGAALWNLWFTSAPHLANVVNPDYRNVGIGMVVRTEPNGAQTIWGVTDLTLC